MMMVVAFQQARDCLPHFEQLVKDANANSVPNKVVRFMRRCWG
jgi:hypothetical protein